MSSGEESPENETADVVIAVGASAASARPLERFLTELGLPDGAAVVVILQYREALDEGEFKLKLGEAGRALTPIENDMPIEAGKIYLPPPNVIVTAEEGRLRTRPAEQEPGERGTIDSFLVSLARDENGRTIAVLLDGTGGDGVLGATAVKEAGGLILAEETAEIRTGELASSGSPAALADAILPVEALAERVADYARRLAERKEPEAPPTDVAAALRSIATVLRNKTGHDFHGYKQGTFLRRIQRRMQVSQTDDIRRYAELLAEQPDEAQLLFNDLLIGVTQFFRDRREFEILETQIVPQLFAGKTRTDPLRVWVIGCSTGEEAYSIAILLRERMAVVEDPLQIQIFATDIDGRALASARAGRFSDAIAKDVTPERLARWFVREGNTYCVVRELREMCVFSQHSVIKDPPFSRLDLVSCRNLLIYLDADLQSRVLPIFHFALKSGGFLFLGNSENASRHANLFAPVESRSRIFRKLDTGARVLPDLTFTAALPQRADPPVVVRPRGVEAGLTRRAERIVERHAPAYVITDHAFNVLHFSGRAGRYIEPAGGAASLSLLNLAHPDLRSDLRAALSRAGEQNQTTQVENVPVGMDGHRLLVDLVVEPVQHSPAGPEGFVVLFKDGAILPEGAQDGAAAGASTFNDERVLQLQAELRVTRERLQTMIEEYESTNEELTSANEEYQSLNEELQSANEELQTSKEELQSINEELTTVNGELAHKVEELGRANSDLKNLLENTQIATVFLNNDLRVTTYTPAATELFHLVETDVGRPIGHIKPRVAYDELPEDIRRVQRTLGSVDREIVNPANGTRYMVRVLPYRSIDNYIGGVVITFTDVTTLTRAQEAQRESERQARLLLAELQHRVRNTLALMRSIARRTAETSETVEDYAAHLDGRLDAFARVQGAVTRNPAAGIDLKQLVAEELLAHGAHEGKRVTRIEGPMVRFQHKAAETVALILHELTTNAVKYGALSSKQGRIDVTWRIEEAEERPRLAFDWVETGVALSGEEPRRRGFGTELIERTLNYELGGEASLRFERDGLHAAISLPLTRRVVVEQARSS